MVRPPDPHAAGFTALCWRETSCPHNLLGALAALRADAFPWLLDSALSGTRLGRFSFAGADPYLVLRSFGERVELSCRRGVRPDLPAGFRVERGDPFEWVRRLLPAPPASALRPPPDVPFIGGAVGYWGYELAERVDVVELHGRDDLAFPDLTLLFVDRLLALDHEAGRAWAIGLGFAESASDLAAATGRAEQAAEAYAELVERSARIDGSESDGRGAARVDELAERHQLLTTPLPRNLSCTFEPAEYAKRVAELIEEIAAGNVYEANLTQRMALPFSGDSWALYLALRRESPAPFAAYLALTDGAILSSSPERFLHLRETGEVESRPIKGTRPRGSTPETDAALAAELAHSAKDRAENLMIVDLVRNDLGRVCETGSVRVPELMRVERYASVFQLVSSVAGRLRSDCDATDLIRAAFPPGSMTGAPKIAAMRLLDALEPVRRGVYSGAIGYLDLRGGLDLSVVIRTMLVKKGFAYLHVGGAVVADSEPEAEYRETLDKARAMLAALAATEQR